MKLIELLAPAKDYTSAVAAIDWGADAIYIGGAKFGARHAAGNSVEDIARVVEYAHQYGVRVHATLNTLLFDDELAEAEKQARELIAVGVDALIVQDMAMTRMNLDVELHASTQVCAMTIEQVAFLEKCGFSRVILERGLSFDQITKIAAATNIGIECFVHGAICVGHSGRCFLSRSMGSRSGNRGACSQSCRLTYDLVDDQGRALIERKHLLSVRDLNLSEQIGNMVDAGVTSFKIEGRLKDVGYIKNIVGHYRNAIDAAIGMRSDCQRSSTGRTLMDITPNPSKSFTRGESQYLFYGKDKGVASFDTPKSVGEYVGRVVECFNDCFTLDRKHSLTAGDGVCFGLYGTNINGVEGRDVFPNKMDGIEVGMDIYRNFDRKFNIELERSQTRRVIDVEAIVTLSAQEVRVEYIDCEGNIVAVNREGSYDECRSREKMVETIKTQLSKCGNTIFRVQSVEIEGDILFVPSSILADMRREALDKLREYRVDKGVEHNIMSENVDAKYPYKQLSALDNVTNKLSEKFYRDHGVVDIEQGLDLGGDTQGQVVLRSGYCLRREIGECLKYGSKINDPLYLERGNKQYLLKFDCNLCEMSLVDM